MSKMDQAWQEMHNNPPADWREVWNARNKITRADNMEKAHAEQEKLKLKPQYAEVELLIGLHPKDGYVVYYENKTELPFNCTDTDILICQNCQHEQNSTDLGECEECGYEDLVLKTK